MVTTSTLDKLTSSPKRRPRRGCSCTTLSKRGLACLAVGLAVLLAYRYYSPVPEEFSNTKHVSVKVAIGKISSDVLWLISLITGQHFYKLRGQALSFTMGLKNKHLDDLEYEDVTIEQMRVRVYTPAGVTSSSDDDDDNDRSGGAPAVVFYHGGGFILGDIETYHSILSKMAVETNVKVFSVEYRLAPEHLFPTAHVDCVRVTQHILNNSRQYGVDGNRVAVMGDSAGGHLAAVVAQTLRAAAPHPKLQILLYPWLQFIDHMTTSHQANGDIGMLISTDDCIHAAGIYMFGESNHTLAELLKNNGHIATETRAQMEALHMDYNLLPPDFLPPEFNRPAPSSKPLSQPYQDLFTDPWACPLCADDVTGVPPAYIYTAHYDPVRDDGVWYAHKLMRAGIQVEHFHHAPSYHGVIYSLDMGIPEAEEAHDSIVQYIRKYL